MSITPTEEVILVNVSSSRKTVQLPLASQNTGRLFFIRDANGFCTSASTIIIQTTGSDNIEKFVSSVSLSLPYELVMLVSDGITNWYILNNYTNNVPQFAFQTFLCTPQIIAQNFSTVSNAFYNSNSLVPTTGQGGSGTRGGIWTRQKYPTSSFTGNFTFRFRGTAAAHGFCWVMQNNSAGAIGGGGGLLGYAWKLSNTSNTVPNFMTSSVAIRLDLHNGTTYGISSTDFLSTGSIGTSLGQSGNITTNFNFSNNLDFYVNFSYDKQRIFRYSISNFSNTLVLNSNISNINIPLIVDSDAWVGFTSAESIVTIREWNFSASI